MAEPSTVNDLVGKIKSSSGLVGKIKDFIFMGYETDEQLKALDRNIRGEYVKTINVLRGEWTDAMEAVADEGMLDLIGAMKKYLTVSDRVVEKMEHAPAGYSGFFNRAGRVDAESLGKALAHDIETAKDVDALKTLTSAALDRINGGVYDRIKNDTRDLVKALELIENKINDRDKYFTTTQ